MMHGITYEHIFLQKKISVCLLLFPTV